MRKMVTEIGILPETSAFGFARGAMISASRRELGYRPDDADQARERAANQPTGQRAIGAAPTTADGAL
jgi:hypothetical protein